MTMNKLKISAALASIFTLLIGQLSLTEAATDVSANNAAGYSIQVKIEDFGDTNALINNAWIKTSAIKTVTKVYNGKLETSPSVVRLERYNNGVDDISLWRNAIKSGNLIRHDVEITQYNSALKPVRQIRMIGAWPSQSSMSGLGNDTNGKSTETYTFTAHNMIEVIP